MPCLASGQSDSFLKQMSTEKEISPIEIWQGPVMQLMGTYDINNWFNTVKIQISYIENDLWYCKNILQYIMKKQCYSRGGNIYEEYDYLFSYLMIPGDGN